MWDGHYLATFKKDFTIAEAFGQEAIRDTYERAFREWCDNVQYLTELVMVINHKSWEWDRKQNPQMTEFYVDLYYEANTRAITYLEAHNPEGLDYYFEVLD